MKTRVKNVILTLVLITGLGTGKIYAQSPSWQWAKGAGSTGSEAAMGTAVDAGGNLYSIGWYTSANITFGATTLTNPGNFTSDVFLVKFDPSGNVLWAKTFGGVDGDLGNGIAIDLTGNIYITGWYTSASFTMGSYTLSNVAAGTSDVFIAKLDPAGNTVWAKSVGGTSSDRGYGIAVDASGNVFTTGAYASSTINFGTGALTNAGSATNDFFIVKHNASGTTQWSKSCGGTNSDAGLSAATDSLGNVYITGSYSSSAINFGAGVLNNSSAGTQDLFIAKYDGLGTAAWSVRAGGTLDDIGNAVAVMKNAVYVAGAYNSTSLAFGTTTLTNGTAGTSDVLLAKYDLNGNAMWARKSGGIDSEAGNGLAVDSLGRVYITGYFISGSIAFGSIIINDFSVGYRDLFIASYDGNGNALWAIPTGSTYDETANTISVGATGLDVYVGGTFNSALVSFGAYNVYKGCGDDVFIAKLQGPLVGIKEEISEEHFRLFPNPGTGKFSVEAEGQIIFYNALGESIHSQKLNHTNEFDFTVHPKGIYFYRVITDKKTSFTGKVVVQ